MITSVANFEWFATAMVLAMSFGWFIVDTVNLSRELAKDEREHDRVFGYVIGLVLAVMGGLGVLVFFYW